MQVPRQLQDAPLPLKRAHHLQKGTQSLRSYGGSEDLLAASFSALSANPKGPWAPPASANPEQVLLRPLASNDTGSKATRQLSGQDSYTLTHNLLAKATHKDRFDSWSAEVHNPILAPDQPDLKQTCKAGIDESSAPPVAEIQSEPQTKSQGLEKSAYDPSKVRSDITHRWTYC